MSSNITRKAGYSLILPVLAPALLGLPLGALADNAIAEEMVAMQDEEQVMDLYGIPEPFEEPVSGEPDIFDGEPAEEPGEPASDEPSVSDVPTHIEDHSSSRMTVSRKVVSSDTPGAVPLAIAGIGLAAVGLFFGLRT